MKDNQLKPVHYLVKHEEVKYNQRMIVIQAKSLLQQSTILNDTDILSDEDEITQSNNIQQQNSDIVKEHTLAIQYPT